MLATAILLAHRGQHGENVQSLAVGGADVSTAIHDCLRLLLVAVDRGQLAANGPAQKTTNQRFKKTDRAAQDAIRSAPNQQAKPVPPSLRFDSTMPPKN